MTFLLFLLFALFVVSAIIGYFRLIYCRRQLSQGKIDKMPEIEESSDSKCCGRHEVCEKTSLLAGLSPEIVYYDDEELDRFAGTDSSNYSPAAEDEFREILYTMKVSEVAGWVRSLELRGVSVPDGLKDEIFILLN